MMNEFLIMIHYDVTGKIPSLSPDEIADSMEHFRGWIGAIASADKLISLPKVWDPESRIVRQDRDDNPTVEVRSSIGGLFLIKANDYDEAITIAKACPVLKYGAIIEVRMGIA